jgi:hypothetical protein
MKSEEIDHMAVEPREEPMFTNRWCFECPDCEFSNEELGRLASDDENHCLLCMRDRGQLVKLKKWLPKTK